MFSEQISNLNTQSLVYEHKVEYEVHFAYHEYDQPSLPLTSSHCWTQTRSVQNQLKEWLSEAYGIELGDEQQRERYGVKPTLEVRILVTIVSYYVEFIPTIGSKVGRYC